MIPIHKQDTPDAFFKGIGGVFLADYSAEGIGWISPSSKICSERGKGM